MNIYISDFWSKITWNFISTNGLIMSYNFAEQGTFYSPKKWELKLLIKWPWHRSHFNHLCHRHIGDNYYETWELKPGVLHRLVNFLVAFIFYYKLLSGFFLYSEYWKIFIQLFVSVLFIRTVDILYCIVLYFFFFRTQ